MLKPEEIQRQLKFVEEMRPVEPIMSANNWIYEMMRSGLNACLEQTHT